MRSRGRARLTQATGREEIPPSGIDPRPVCLVVRNGVASKVSDQVVVHDLPESGHEGIHGGVARDAGRIGHDLFAPDEAGLLVTIDHMRKEAAEDDETETLTETGGTQSVRQGLVGQTGRPSSSRRQVILRGGPTMVAKRRVAEPMNFARRSRVFETAFNRTNHWRTIAPSDHPARGTPRMNVHLVR